MTPMTVSYWLGVFLGFCAGWAVHALVVLRRYRRELSREFADILMDKQAAQDAARVKDLELQRITR